MNPSDSDAEANLKWLDGSAYNTSLVGFNGDMGSFCHRQYKYTGSKYMALPCNTSRTIICQFDCSNLNEGRPGLVIVGISRDESQQHCSVFQFISAPTAYENPHPGTFPYSGNITRHTPTIRRISMGRLRSVRRNRVLSSNIGRMTNSRLRRSCSVSVGAVTKMI